jgi:hypothetical protein
MIKKPLEILSKYADAFRDLINARVWASGDSPKKLLRLNDDRDWDFICVAMDVIGDASLAIGHFLQFGLDGPTKYDDTGEKYLRLYGLLSAVYIQEEATLKLYSLMHCPNPKDAKAEFNKLEIRMLRHQLASHSVDFIESKDEKPHAFVPVRIGLDGFLCVVTENRGEQHRTIKLDDAIIAHCQMEIAFLDKIYEKSIKTLFRGQENKIREFQKVLEDLRFEKEGNIIIRTSRENSSEIRIIFSKPIT